MYEIVGLLTALVICLGGWITYLLARLSVEKECASLARSESQDHRKRWLGMLESESNQQLKIDDLETENENLKQRIKDAQALLCSAVIEKEVTKPLPPPPPQGEPMHYV